GGLGFRRDEQYTARGSKEPTLVIDRMAASRPAHPDAEARFTARSVAFLRALERHNRRDWFRARKARYDEVVRGPMLALVQRFAADLPAFAPDLVADPRVSLYRPYRDTRFSADKAPIKTHIGALFPHRLLPRHEGAGFYVEVAPHRVWYGGGMYMPSTTALQQVREHVAAHHRRLARIVSAPAFRRTYGVLEGNRLQRVPRGFPADHPAADFLKHRQFLAGCERPAEFAASPAFYRTVLAAFKALAPLTAFLNEPLLAALRSGELGRPWTDAAR
ncbi:MAG TPA: DUF2461 domain-containing protein, partial [Vicinamibacterales bacterium]|nr:DUF2461 domain-containing protein [Vicinamibacterales bacterium]